MLSSVGGQLCCRVPGLSRARSTRVASAAGGGSGGGEARGNSSSTRTSTGGGDGAQEDPSPSPDEEDPQLITYRKVRFWRLFFARTPADTAVSFSRHCDRVSPHTPPPPIYYLPPPCTAQAVSASRDLQLAGPAGWIPLVYTLLALLRAAAAADTAPDATATEAALLACEGRRQEAFTAAASQVRPAVCPYLD